MSVEILVILVLAIAAGGVVFLIANERRERETRNRLRREMSEEFRGGVIDRLSNSVPFVYGDYAEQCGITTEEAELVASELYTKFCRQIISAGVVTPGEWQKLAWLVSFLALNDAESTSIETETKGKVYREAVKLVLSKGVVTAAEARSLADLRISLGVSNQTAFEKTADLSRAAYYAFMDRVANEGRVTPETKAQATWLKQGLAIRHAETTCFEPGRAASLYYKMFGLIIQDDEISTEAVQALDWLQWEIHVPLPVVTECQNQIREIKRLAGYRQGLLPTVPTALILESGEICHWSGRCTYLQQTARVSRLHDGTLVVTSKQIMFTSMSKPFTFSPSKIIKIGSSQDGIVLHTMSRTGAGEYQTHEPLALEAILTGLVHKHKYLLTDKPDPARSRHIPTRVQAEVRARDSDSCVKCGAREYLEFDHIIPHSKGGANTTGNIQILCRKCNGAKGNRV